MATLARPAFDTDPDYPDPDYRPGGSLFDVGLILAIVRRNMWIIAGIVGAALGVALIATLLASPRYTATATVQVNETADRVLSEDETDNSADVWNYDLFLQTQVDVLTSRSLAERVGNVLDLKNSPEFFSAFGIDIGKLPKGDKAREAEVVSLLRGHLAAPLPRNTRILPLMFTSGDGAVSMRVINAYAEQLIEANLQRKFDSSSYARGFVADQLTEAKERLATSEQALNDYARSSGIVRLADPTADGDESGSGPGSITTASLAQLNEAANQARAARIGAESRWNAVANGPLYGSQPVLADPTVASLLVRQAQAEAALAEEQARHLPDHPSVIAAKAELQQIQSDLSTAANNVRRSVRSDYEAARAAEQKLAAQVNALKGETLSEQDSAVQYALLAREADTNRQLYEELLQRYKQLNAAAGISASNISIIDKAQVPAVPSSPSLKWNLLLGLFAGLVVAAVVVFLRTELDDSIRVPEDIEDKLDMHLLGIIPVEAEENLAGALSDPKSQVSEAYSSLRGSLLYATPEGLPPTILVTSSQPSEGKSTTCRALAQSFVRVGKRVALVDADIRRPTLHRVLGVENDRGLTTVLTGQASIADTIRTNEGDGVAYMTAGPVSPAPSELISSPQMQEVIDLLAEQYDLVILDSSPVLGLADAPALSVLVDGVIFVVEANRGRRGVLKSSLRRLRAMRGNILGAVLTKFDPQAASNSYSSYYGYNYYEYRDEESRKVA